MNIDFLQMALLFLIILLSIFLTITGFQVFLILRDLKKTLDKFNKFIQTGEIIAKDVDVDNNSRSARIREKPITAASRIVTSIEEGAASLVKRKLNPQTPKPRRFYKKIMK